MRFFVLLSVLCPAFSALAVPVCTETTWAEPGLGSTSDGNGVGIRSEGHDDVGHLIQLETDTASNLVSALPSPLPSPEDGATRLASSDDGQILPCATADGGFFGSLCVEATVYVVTDAGVVLCNIQVPPLHLEHRVPARLQDHTLPGQSRSVSMGVGSAWLSASTDGRPVLGPSYRVRLPPTKTFAAHRNVVAEPPLLPG